jgi:hypothetical protein
MGQNAWPSAALRSTSAYLSDGIFTAAARRSTIGSSKARG